MVEVISTRSRSVEVDQRPTARSLSRPRDWLPLCQTWAAARVLARLKTSLELQSITLRDPSAVRLLWALAERRA